MEFKRKEQAALGKVTPAPPRRGHAFRHTFILWQLYLCFQKISKIFFLLKLSMNNGCFVAKFWQNIGKDLRKHYKYAKLNVLNL
jgi:hypothetical protein